jgi:bifunctional DNA-binding transcriptional regulator/antitoxin component of YhaV-PrlF toxin-antitoxin module
MQAQPNMEEVVAGLTTKSEKIRRLGNSGYTRQQIADFLGIRYQHVRNVLIDELRKQQGAKRSDSSPGAPEVSKADSFSNSSGKARLRADGSVVLPEAIRAAAGINEGDPLFVRVAAEGEVHLLSGRAAIRYAQYLLRDIIPEDVSLVDELLKECRREAQDE